MDPPPRSPYGVWEQGGPRSGRFAGIDEEPHTGIATAVGMATRLWAPRLSQVGKPGYPAIRSHRTYPIREVPGPWPTAVWNIRLPRAWPSVLGKSHSVAGKDSGESG